MVRIARARDLADPRSPTETQVIAAYFAAHLHQLRGEARAAQDRAESAIALADDYGLSVWLALAHMIRGWARAELGAFEDGIDELRRGLAAYDATGARLWRAQSLGFLAQALGRIGRDDEGLAAALEAVNLVGETGEDGAAADLYRIQGDLLLARATADGRPVTQAAECLTRAVAIARAQQARSWELRASTSLARIYHQQGKAADAVGLITPVLNSFTEGHDTSDVIAARRVANEASGQTSQTV